MMLWMLCCVSAAKPGERITIVDRPDTAKANDYYTLKGNKFPRGNP
jgi:hypothetical protein